MGPYYRHEIKFNGSVWVFFCALLLASCGDSERDGVSLHFALNEARNTLTGMTTSKIEIASSLRDCEEIREDTLTGYRDEEYFEIINSVCVDQLPGRLVKPFEGDPRYLEVVVKYARNNIRTTEIFYSVDESWSDKHACEFVKGLFARLGSDPACYSHQVARNPFDDEGMSIDMEPTIERVTIENEQRELSRRENAQPE